MCDMKWKRISDPDIIIHTSVGGRFDYKIIRAARAVYEVFQKCTPDGVDVDGKLFPVHFKWYYLTSFKGVSSARDFVMNYDTDRISLTSFEREPVTVAK